MDRSKRFWNKIAKRYAKQPITDQATYEEKLRITRQYLTSDMAVLELGCGTGSTAIEHAPFVKHIHATDVAKNMLEIAQQKVRDADIHNISLECIAMEDIDISDGTIDAILALNVLHLIKDIDSTISKVHSMLKPGGIFISSTVCIGDSIKFRMIKFAVSIGAFFGLLPAINSFTVNQLTNKLIEVGFTIDHQWQPGPNKAVLIVASKLA